MSDYLAACDAHQMEPSAANLDRIRSARDSCGGPCAECEHAAKVLVDHAGEDPRQWSAVVASPAYALYVWRRARSHVHPLWTGPLDPGWDEVAAAAAVLGLQEPPDPGHVP